MTSSTTAQADNGNNSHRSYSFPAYRTMKASQIKNAPSTRQHSMWQLAKVSLMMSVLCLSSPLSDAFSLSMVASGAPRVGQHNIRKSPVTPLSPTPSVTSGLISQLAVIALKLRLREQAGVKCDVTTSSSDLLLKGKVGPVTVKGRGWKSQLGLTCRAIEATVECCDLDMGRVFSNQKLVLTTPAKGSAMIALDSADFGNFITHPLMKPPGLSQESGEGLRFLKEGVVIDATRGSVNFLGSYMGEKWRCTLQRGSDEKRALVTVVPDTGDKEKLRQVSAELTEVTSRFFNEMVFELDGTFLTFRDMMVTAKGGVPSIMLALQIMVKKFPSPGLSF